VSSAELAAYWRPYMGDRIERFGPEPCMFESNFPVEKMGSAGRPLWNAFKRIAAGVSVEGSWPFQRHGRRVYRLD